MFASFQVSPELVPAAERAALRREALQVRDTARRNERGDFRLVDDKQLLSPARNWSADAGDRRRELHEQALGGRLASLLKVRLGASLSSYLYYERDDFLGLHTDQAACRFAVLVWLDGNAGPLFVHPQLRGVAPEQLLQQAVRHNGHPPDGIPVRLQDGPLLLAGNAIPHHRPRHAGTSEVVLAAFCFTAKQSSG